MSCVKPVARSIRDGSSDPNRSIAEAVKPICFWPCSGGGTIHRHRSPRFRQRARVLVLMFRRVASCLAVSAGSAASGPVAGRSIDSLKSPMSSRRVRRRRRPDQHHRLDELPPPPRHAKDHKVQRIRLLLTQHIVAIAPRSARKWPASRASRSAAPARGRPAAAIYSGRGRAARQAIYSRFITGGSEPNLERLNDFKPRLKPQRGPAPIKAASPTPSSPHRHITNAPLRFAAKHSRGYGLTIRIAAPRSATWRFVSAMVYSP